MSRENIFPRRIENEHIFSSDMQFRVDLRTIAEPYPVHCHEFYELEYILSGKGVHNLNGVESMVSPGSFYLLTPADFHSVTPVSGNIKNYNLMFSRDWLSDELARSLYTSRRPFAGELFGEAARRMISVLERLEFEYNTDGKHRHMVLGSLVNVVLCDVLNVLEKPEAETTPYGSDIQKALWYIENHFSEPLRLGDIAQHVHLSNSYFSLRFKQAVGQPFSTYLQELRLEYAYNLLKSSEMPVSDVCYHSGFGTMEHFVRLFKKRYGHTPGEIRTSAKNIK